MSRDVDARAERLNDAEVLVLIRERTQIRAPLCWSVCHGTRLISRRASHGIRISDIDACTGLGIIVSSSQHADRPSCAAAELTWGLVLAAMRQIPQQMAALKAGKWQIGVGHTLVRDKTLGILRLWPDRQRGRRLRPRVRHEGAGVGARATLAQARADGYEARSARATRKVPLGRATCARCICAWSRPPAARTSQRRRISQE